MRYRLKHLEIAAFRGIRDSLKIPLDKPLVVVYGPNGSGKSTITAAIEWALFPKEATRIGEHAIRERTDWEIRHIHCDEEAYVRLILTNGSQDLVIEQTTAKTKRKRGESFDEKSTLNGTYGDFKGLAYVHQETIRDFLIGQPKPREDAFQRLLGAGWIQDLAEIIDNSAKRLCCDAADDRVEALNNQLEARMQEAGRELRERERAASDAKIKEPWEQSARNEIGNTENSIKNICENLKIAIPSFPEPEPFQNYSKRLRSLLDNIRLAGPGQEHTKLSSRKTALEVSVASYLRAETELSEKRDAYQEGQKTVGTREEFVARTTKLNEDIGSLNEKLNFLNQERSVMRAALDYFRTTREAKTCPACLREGIPADIADRLQKRLEAEASQQEKNLQHKLHDLQDKLRNEKNLANNLANLEQEVGRAEESLCPCQRELETHLGHEIGQEESPADVARAEIEKLANELEGVKSAVAELQQKIATIETAAERVDQIGAIIAARRRVEDLGRVREMHEWKEMIRTQEALSGQELAFKLRSQEVRRLSATFAQHNLDRARSPITAIYHQLTRRADFPSVSIEPQKKYAIEVSGNSGSQKVTAILNQTDLDALAIAVVAGMAKTFPEVHDFDFLILDDPSQGMDPEVTGGLAEVIGSISEQLQVVVTTPDPVMFQALKKSTRKKRLIKLKPRDWESAAPFVQLESVSGG
jgi:DNA repair exonuclease SbcCD ATPase subunit